MSDPSKSGVVPCHQCPVQLLALLAICACRQCLIWYATPLSSPVFPVLRAGWHFRHNNVSVAAAYDCEQRAFELQPEAADLKKMTKAHNTRPEVRQTIQETLSDQSQGVNLTKHHQSREQLAVLVVLVLAVDCQSEALGHSLICGESIHAQCSCLDGSSS